MTSPVG